MIVSKLPILLFCSFSDSLIRESKVPSTPLPHIHWLFQVASFFSSKSRKHLVKRNSRPLMTITQVLESYLACFLLSTLQSLMFILYIMSLFLVVFRRNREKYNYSIPPKILHMNFFFYQVDWISHCSFASLNVLICQKKKRYEDKMTLNTIAQIIFVDKNPQAYINESLFFKAELNYFTFSKQYN